MYKVAVIGDYDSIYGFAAVGFHTVPVTEAGEGAQKLKELADGRYAVIYITEALAAQIPDAVDLYREKQIPAVILIPGVAGNTGAGIAQVKKSVERAVGSDIIFGTE